MRHFVFFFCLFPSIVYLCLFAQMASQIDGFAAWSRVFFLLPSVSYVTVGAV